MADETDTSRATTKVQEVAASVQQAIAGRKRISGNKAESVARRYFEAIGAHDLDAAVAIGVDVDVDLASADLIQHDGDAHRARAAVAELGVALPATSKANLDDQVVGPLARKADGAHRGALERVARRRHDVAPGRLPNIRRRCSDERGQEYRNDHCVDSSERILLVCMSFVRIMAFDVRYPK